MDLNYAALWHVTRHAPRATLCRYRYRCTLALASKKVGQRIRSRSGTNDARCRFVAAELEARAGSDGQLNAIRFGATS
jgi:hypothetical protein